MPITVYLTNPQSATRKVFQAKVLGKANYAGSRVKTIRPDPKIATEVAADLGAIGQLSFALNSGNKGVKLIDPMGQKAVVENPKYPITRPLYLITKGAPSGPVREFITWARSAAGQKLVKKNFVGIQLKPAAKPAKPAKPGK